MRDLGTLSRGGGLGTEVCSSNLLAIQHHHQLEHFLNTVSVGPADTREILPLPADESESIPNAAYLLPILGMPCVAVSYTHLTLPTILLV